ncbi:MAG: hypothetical protein AVDCRST_MAG49-2321 [uncultured Thermomicrobiales bacterium]|uniref:DUF4097 domain-containing protein n=1 Tax=uncultured Thermomicrobiales bacterium TaxID=1645740 RepID=A0A6J4UVW5_9BACT|nr:MAG: hypothetical protein AVDCRST_MAG49-2321 [uncultured Thermomicrobiales bacterium]
MNAGIGQQTGDATVDIDPGQPLRVTVGIASGRVAVRTSDRADLAVHWRASGRRNGDADLAVEASGNRVEIGPRQGRGGKFPGLGRVWGDGGHFDVEIDLPRLSAPTSPGGEPRTTLQVKTASAGVEVVGVEGSVSVTTASGEARLIDVTGSLSVQSASGDAIVSGASGQLTVHSASGDVRADAGELTHWSFRTASGDVSLAATPVGAGPFEAQTVSGDVVLALRLPEASGGTSPVTVSFGSVSGDADVAAPFRREPQTVPSGRGAGRAWRLGPEGAVATHLAVKTVSGDLRIRAEPMAERRRSAPQPTAGPADQAAPAAPSPRAPEAPAAPMAAMAPMAPKAPTAPNAPMTPVAPMAPIAAPAPTVAAAPDVAVPPVPPVPLFPAGLPFAHGQTQSPPLPGSGTDSTEPRSDDIVGNVADATPEGHATTTGATDGGSASRLEVLQALERGELDIDEAMTLLDGLNRDAAETADANP